MVAKLFSKLDYPVSVKYGDSNIQIPAFAFNMEVLEDKKLGELPQGVRKIVEKGAK